MGQKKSETWGCEWELAEGALEAPVDENLTVRVQGSSMPSTHLGERGETETHFGAAATSAPVGMESSALSMFPVQPGDLRARHSGVWRGALHCPVWGSAVLSGPVPHHYGCASWLTAGFPGTPDLAQLSSQPFPRGTQDPKEKVWAAPGAGSPLD